jgi:sigma-B regulation protein RsbU (phosphoserine phosphatase)
MGMMIIGRTELRAVPRFIFRWLAIICAGVLPMSAQNVAGEQADVLSSGGISASAALPSVLSVDGPWRFQIGDDPRWADPAFDDSSWPTVTLSLPLSIQGFSTYSGYAWYRLRLRPQQFTAFGNPSTNTPLDVLVSGNSVGQLALYVDGNEAGRTRGMTDPPAMYQSPPFVAHLSAPDASGARVLAVRTWAGPNITIGRGLLTKVELGSSSDIAEKLDLTQSRQWNESAISAMVVAFLFFCVAGLGAALFLAQRHHAEYLWLALLCLSASAGGAADAAFGLSLMPLSVYRFFTHLTGRIFMAVTLEFVLHFTASPARRLVRVVQAALVLMPFVYFLQMENFYEVLSVMGEVVFCVLVCVLLFQAWRRGSGEAGIMLLPFFLAATADSADTVLDFAASGHWIPEQFASHRFHFGPIEFGTGTVSYTVFLGSLVAVILYRFIRVSQDEQRSSAEVAAARSVQALLIPTQLPSNKNFMLESAYLPVNGVGGDFFQVLPLKDDSLLIVVGDVSGKGLQAAMNSSTLVGALRNELSHDPGTVLDHLNRVLLGAVSTPGAVPGLDSAPCFATCLCARIYPDGTLTIANAGHLSPYRDGRELELPPGLPLGVIADSNYEQTTFQLNRGDRLVFMSDGVVEATNHEGELFGFERTQQVSNEPARYIAQTAQRFGQTDDITVVSLYVASRAAQRTSEQTLQTS